MKMFDKEKQIRLWGNHIDPEVSAEKYLKSDHAEVSQWAAEHERELQQMDRTPLTCTAATRQIMICEAPIPY